MNVVRVRARRDGGFWRGGVHWPHVWTEAQVDDELLVRLQAERMLVVELVPPSPPLEATPEPTAPPAPAHAEPRKRR